MSAEEHAEAAARQRARHQQHEHEGDRAGRLFAMLFGGLILLLGACGLYLFVRLVKWAWTN
jgi:hypothetical protein